MQRYVAAPTLSHSVWLFSVMRPLTLPYGPTVYLRLQLAVLSGDSLTEGQLCTKEKRRRVSGWALWCSFTTIWTAEQSLPGLLREVTCWQRVGWVSTIPVLSRLLPNCEVGEQYASHCLPTRWKCFLSYDKNAQNQGFLEYS